MPDKLLFEPKKLRKLEPPFTILRETRRKGKRLIKFITFTENELPKAFSENLLKKEWETLALFSDESTSSKAMSIEFNHGRLKLKTDRKDYLKKHLSDYFYRSFQKIFPVLAKLNTYHKTLTQNKRYRNSACGFSQAPAPELSFKLFKKGKELGLDIFYTIDGKTINSVKLKRFKFLVCYGETYYCLKKTHWLLLEELDYVDSFSHREFREKYYPKLKNFPLDSSAAFTIETREIEPETIIQISELGGNLLLFLPRWDYDGTVVDDDRDSFAVYEDDKKVIYKRNKEAEEKTLQFLTDAHPNFKGKNSFYLTFDQASKKNWFFNFYYDQLKDNFTVTGMDMLSYFRYSDEPINTDFKIKKTVDNEITADFKTYFGKEKVPVKTLQKAIREGQDFVLLKDNSLGVLTEKWRDKYGLILKNAQSEKDEVSFSKWLLLATEQDSDYQQYLKMVLPENWMAQWKKWNGGTEKIYQQPESVQAKLRNYQQKGYEWINLMAEVQAGTLLADDMGLGKTLQTITSLVYWQKEKTDSRFLIVCPASLIYNWKKEFEKFVPQFKLSVYHGFNRNFDDFLTGDANILITSYALIRNDSEEFDRLIWDGIVLDESHKIKNYNAKQTQAVLQLKGKRRIILNGTPIMNNISDLFPQLKFILPQLFISPQKFKDQYEKPIQRKGNQQPMEMLKKITDPFILRRTKEMAAPDLPQKTESVMWCEMGMEQEEAYENIKQQVKENVFVEIDDKGLNKAKLGVLQGITKLRQACSSPQILKDEPDFDGVPSVKIDSLINELTSNLKDEKVLIFSQYLGTMDLLQEAFEEHQIEFCRFSGETPSEKRMDLVSEFQDENSSIQVFLLSLMAGNAGINLSNANYVFLVEPWWNKAVQQQAIDRAHRIGQKQKVFAYNMICKNSIEEKIIQLQNKKQSLSEEIISDDPNFVKNLTEDDIAFLFE